MIYEKGLLNKAFNRRLQLRNLMINWKALPKYIWLGRDLVKSMAVKNLLLAESILYLLILLVLMRLH